MFISRTPDVHTPASRRRRPAAGPRAACERLEPRTLFQAGDLDTTFSVDGKATITPPSGSFFSAADVAVQAGGLPVVVGSSQGRLAVARYTTTGSLDTSFGGSGTGIVLLDVSDVIDNPNYDTLVGNAIAVQPADDKIVVVGTASVSITLASVIVAARLLPSGLLDTSFSGDGKDAIHSFEDELASAAADVAIQQDGKIVIAGNTIAPVSHETDMGVARYNTNGTLDNSFAGNGTSNIGFGDDEVALGVALDYSGSATNPKIILAGRYSVDAAEPRFAVARVNSNGSLDDSFDSDGKRSFTFDGRGASARDVVVQPGGKMVIAGFIDEALGVQGGDFAVFRLNTNGSTDSSFGLAGGLVQIDFDGNGDGARDVMIGQTGRLLVGGASSNRMALACLTSEGVIDPVFSGDGKQTVSFAGGATAEGLAAAPGGRVFAAGGSDFATAKFYDRAPATVYIASLDAVASEPPGLNTASFTVFRDEVLPNTTSVLIFVSGSATAPGQGVNPDYIGFSATPGSNFVDVPGGAGSASITITPRDDTRVEGDETAVFTILPRLGIYDIAQPPSVTLTIRDNDVTGGPVVTSSAYVFDAGPPQRVRFSFNQDVVGSIGSNDFSVTGPSGPVPFSLAYDSITNTATLGLSGGLPNGNYTARVIAAGLTNAAGTPMAADAALSFFVLAGDIDRNRSVNGSDFAILAGNFGKTAMTYEQGDLNGDGSINGSDFAILAGNFGRSVPPPTAAVTLASYEGPTSDAAPAERATQPNGMAPAGAISPAKRVALARRRTLTVSRRPLDGGRSRLN